MTDPAGDGRADAGSTPLLGYLAGLGAAVAGLLLWGLVVAVTGYQLGIVAVGVGWLVGLAVRRFGGGTSSSAAVGAATMAGLAMVVGFVGTRIVGGVVQVGITVSEALRVVGEYGWPQFTVEAVGWVGVLCLALGVWTAYRTVAGRAPAAPSATGET